ncbi:MerR family transcriptional regulator [Streptomyces sp. NBC_01363]|uniref:MerR family transcriptional regulator n=1 Tax=Streptomyces sp. NBC_01363 TaxID=2903840 RepID=UPI00225831E3|nr:MerR family transcriptional regulator [Streptomyces sp. NBC_01363]MCX4732291.1 MerR family transcriptional regulator [Streptomyces sp. NBC_01363]
MNGDALLPIGDLARLTGLTVKTIRFYSDRGIVPPADRTPAGYRLYGPDAVARLRLVRTLRELGLDLPTIRKVADRELSLPEVAAAHAQALTVQIRTLRMRRAVLAAAARRGSTPEELEPMHELARLSEHERRDLIDDFLATAFGGPDAAPGFAGIRRSMTPELPENPDTEQVEAWIELAELTQDPDFAVLVRRMADHVSTDLTRPDPTAMVRDHVTPALRAGIAPTSPQAAPVIKAITTEYAHTTGHDLLPLLETANDPRRQRYLQLLAVINSWPPPDDPRPAFTWLIEALASNTTADAPEAGRT